MHISEVKPRRVARCQETQPSQIKSDHVPRVAQPPGAVRRHREAVADQRGSTKLQGGETKVPPIRDGVGWKVYSGLEYSRVFQGARKCSKKDLKMT